MIGLTADHRVKAWMLEQFCLQRSKHHLSSCVWAEVSDVKVYESSGVWEYARLDCTITCEHGESYEYTYDGFGNLVALLQEILAIKTEGEK